ncbi:hypothetical protein Pelo_16181 [Pelomyxa schiedti]|nr:hypothetical protein Pelo_16181 [Pelomyxa schiedti]
MRSSAHSQDNASHVENVTAATAGRWRTTYEDRATPTSTADRFPAALSQTSEPSQSCSRSCCNLSAAEMTACPR